MKYVSSEVALCLYNSTIQPCIEYCCHVWSGSPSCFLELFGKVQKWICQTVGAILAASLEPLAQCCQCQCSQLKYFYRYYFGRFSSEAAQLVQLNFLILEGSLPSILTLFILYSYCIIFLSPYQDVTRMSISTVSFLAQLDSGILCL